MKKFNACVETVKRGISKAGLKVKIHSPEILVVVGTVGVVTSAVLACKSTLKLDEVLDEGKKKSDKIHKVMEHPEKYVENPEDYSEADAKKDLTTNMVQTGVKVVKLYAGPVIIGTLSLGMIFASNNILRKRNAATLAAYTALDTAFSKYRQNVVDRFGTKVDEELRFNLKSEKVLDEEGNETGEVKVTADVENDKTVFWFGPGNPLWENDSEYILWRLKGMQAHINDLCRANGYLFQNDVCRMMYLEERKEGQWLGWIWEPNDNEFKNYISLGIEKYLSGEEEIPAEGIPIELRTDGNILQLMK